MNQPLLALDRLRGELGQTWIIVTFGAMFAISQITMGAIIRPIGSAFLWLQCCALTAEDYRHTFDQWQAAGLMENYRAHLIVDGVHWFWYAGFFTAVLCRLFQRLAVSSRWNAILLLPLASGLCDWLENRLQLVFLSAADDAMIADPLPLISAAASIGKWSLGGIYVGLIAILLMRLLAGNTRRERVQP